MACVPPDGRGVSYSAKASPFERNQVFSVLHKSGGGVTCLRFHPNNRELDTGRVAPVGRNAPAPHSRG